MKQREKGENSTKNKKEFLVLNELALFLWRDKFTSFNHLF